MVTGFFHRGRRAGGSGDEIRGEETGEEGGRGPKSDPDDGNGTSGDADMHVSSMFRRSHRVGADYDLARASCSS